MNLSASEACAGAAASFIVGIRRGVMIRLWRKAVVDRSRRKPDDPTSQIRHSQYTRCYSLVQCNLASRKRSPRYKVCPSRRNCKTRHELCFGMIIRDRRSDLPPISNSSTIYHSIHRPNSSNVDAHMCATLHATMHM